MIFLMRLHGMAARIIASTPAKSIDTVVLLGEDGAQLADAAGSLLIQG